MRKVSKGGREAVVLLVAAALLSACGTSALPSPPTTTARPTATVPPGPALLPAPQQGFVAVCGSSGKSDSSLATLGAAIQDFASQHSGRATPEVSDVGDDYIVFCDAANRVTDITVQLPAPMEEAAAIAAPLVTAVLPPDATYAYENTAEPVPGEACLARVYTSPTIAVDLPETSPAGAFVVRARTGLNSPSGITDLVTVAIYLTADDDSVF